VNEAVSDPAVVPGTDTTPAGTATAAESAAGPATPPVASDELHAADAEAPSAEGHEPAEEASDGGVGGLEDVPRFVQVEVTSVVFTLPGTSPIVQLREADAPYRTVYFPIGLPEAQAIALALAHEFSPRPSTAELLSAVVTATNADVVAVRITAAKEGTMHGELDLMTARGRSVLDCRPSDGIALVLRQHSVVPLLCEESLLDF
jgi:bifunctional DNase/RNase